MKVLAKILAAIVVTGAVDVHAEELSRSFELRYFSNDVSANGETDYKGGTAVLTTDERVEYLSYYADFASKYFGDPELDDEVVGDDEVSDVLARLKPQPLPEVRTVLPLEEWSWLGYKEGQHEESMQTIMSWNDIKGASVANGCLEISQDNVKVERSVALQDWRLKFTMTANIPADGSPSSLVLRSSDTVVAGVTFDGAGNVTCASEGRDIGAGSYKAGNQAEIAFEVDFVEGRYNLLIDGEKRADFVPLSSSVKSIDTVGFVCARSMKIDSLYGVGYHEFDNVRHPFEIHTFMDEQFSVKPSTDGWCKPQYTDAGWEKTTLPHVHGSERYAGEDLYLRTTVNVGAFERAILDIETLDPEGEIYVNGVVAAVIQNRHPVKLDVTRYLKPDAENLICVKVRYYNMDEFGQVAMGHTPLDHNMGWFAGRAKLVLTPQTYIGDAFVFTKSLGNPAKLEARIDVTNDAPLSFTGTVRATLTPWFPTESSQPSATVDIPVVASSGAERIVHEIELPDPVLWTVDKPYLYKVRVELFDEDGTEIDDKVFTTGIRTVEQTGGTFHLNGRPDMLNGAQTFGFRSPIEKLVTWCRCCPPEWLAKEILMIKKMNGNLLRVHVHAWQTPAKNINDPRLAEMADQMGMMLIWATPAWLRTGKGWNQVDFKGYPKYMRQVYNHPSIVMWEVSNHPNTFKGRHYSESNRFCEKAYKTLYPVDPSRLISISSFIKHMHYGNDAGTIDQEGNPIIPTPAWTAPKVTRGNQDSATGYGHEWSALRTWASEYYQSMLDSPERAYFNFEHQESIGQPNWNLVKGKPWYKLQSYEWKYDDGSIGRYLQADEWRESQAWQAFSAFEAIKFMRLLDYDGFSWCCLHGGPNTATYKKPIIDYEGHAKLAWHANKMAFQRILAGSGDIDIVYGPEDSINPVVMNLGGERVVDVTVTLMDADGQRVTDKTYKSVKLKGGRTVTRLEPFKPNRVEDGPVFVEYTVSSH